MGTKKGRALVDSPRFRILNALILQLGDRARDGGVFVIRSRARGPPCLAHGYRVDWFRLDDAPLRLFFSRREHRDDLIKDPFMLSGSALIHGRYVGIRPPAGIGCRLKAAGDERKTNRAAVPNCGGRGRAKYFRLLSNGIQNIDFIGS
jgi:hypothetical protein